MRADPNSSLAESEGIAPLFCTGAKLFRAGTLDGAVFISNRFWCKAPAKRVSLAPGHVVAVARLDGTGPSTRDLLNTLAPITCTRRLPIPRRRVGRHDDRARTYRVLSGGDSRAGRSALL